MQIKCHQSEHFSSLFSPHSWNEPDHNKREDNHTGRAWRSCSYCSSIHPEDFLEMLKQKDVLLNGADWKYGWPHKFYVEYPNPTPSKEYIVGGEYKAGISKDIYGKSGSLHGKFYNVHLNDCDEKLFEDLSYLIEQRMKIKFVIEEGNMKYKAPHRGFQHSDRLSNLT